jgi:hypothetical protein
LIFFRQRIADLGRQSVEPERNEAEQVEVGHGLQFFG